MGIFGGNYSKPGRGISVEEASKRNYFAILWRKLWKICQANLVYILYNFVFIAALIYFILPFVMPADNASLTETAEYVKNVLQAKVSVPVYIFIPFIFMGPATAALTYVVRNFSKQEPVFVWSDFWIQTKKNFKQALLAGTILTAITYFYINAVIFYINITGGSLVVVMLAFISGFLFVLSSFYVYPIMVTFDMKLAQIFKNSFLMAILNLPQNLLALFSVLIVNLLLFNHALPIWIFLSVILLIAWDFYTINFAAWNAIEKYMLSKTVR